MLKRILNKLTHYLPLILFLVVIPAAIKLITPVSFTFHDETQIVNLQQFIKTIDLGQFPPRWALDMHFTYGSPYPEFNYQLPYYLGFLANKLGFSLFDSYTLCLAFSLFLGAFGMYLFAKKLTTPLASFAAATLYTYTPYRAVDTYVRGTVGESFALALFPWIFYTLTRLKEKQSLKNIIFFSISVTSLTLSHQPSTAFGLPIIIGIFFIPAILNHNRIFLISSIKGLLISIGLSAYYLFPVFLEKNFIQEVIPFNLYDHFPFIKQLLYSPWGYGASNWGPYDGLSFQIGITNIIVLITAIIFVGYRLVSRKKAQITYLFTTFVALLIVLFLMNIRSSFLWKINPFTNAIQFPWRLLSLTTILTATLFVFITKDLRSKILIFFSLLVFLLSFSLTVNYFRPGEITNTSDDYFLRRYLPNQVLLSGETVSPLYLDYTENYIPLPKNAVRPNTVPISKITPTLSSTLVEIENSNPFKTTAIISSLTDDVITINNFYFPGWNIKIDGTSVDVTLDKQGAMLVVVPSGRHTLSLSYLDTPVRRISNIISIVTWSIAVLILIKKPVNIIHGKHRRT